MSSPLNQRVAVCICCQPHGDAWSEQVDNEQAVRRASESIIPTDSFVFLTLGTIPSPRRLMRMPL